MNKHYRERFHVDAVDAVNAAKDLQELGVNYTQEQLDRIKQAEEQPLRQLRVEREAKKRERLAELYDDCPNSCVHTMHSIFSSGRLFRKIK